MNAAFRWIIARHLAKEKPRTLLTLLGVALGVGVFVSVRLASTSALASFTDTVDAVAGRANLELGGGSEGIDERVFPLVRAMAGVVAAAPIVQIDALARPLGPAARGASDIAESVPSRTFYPDQVLVLGVDVFCEAAFERFRLWGDADSATATVGLAALAFLRDPHAAAITRSFATRHQLMRGDSLTVLSSGRPVVLTVRSILESQALQQAYGGNIVIVDLAVAQEQFHRLGRLDRIDLVVDPARHDAVAAELAHRLPAGVAVETPRGRSRQVENMVRAFQLNLTALSFIALFVASFLIINTVSMSVTRRRREIGIVRALGMTRRQVAALFVSEGLFFGVGGGAIGLALGTLLAQGTLGAVSQTLSDLYLVYHARSLRVDLASYAIAYVLGVVVAFVAALVPALEAAGTPAATTVREGAFTAPEHARFWRWTLAGVILISGAALVAVWTVRARQPWGGFASAALVLAAGSVLAPGFTLAIESAVAPLARRLGGIEAALATGWLRASVARTSVVVAALMVSVGMWVALSIMVGSFRRTVDTWIQQSVRGDLYVEPAGHRLNLSSTVLSAAWVDSVRATVGVAAVDTYRASRITYGNRPAFVAGIDFEVQRRFGHLSFTRGDAAAVLARARARDEVLASESFAHHHRVAPGDSIVLAGANGALRRLRVAGVFYDYTTDAGVVMMDRGLYARMWGERTESLALYLSPGTDADAVRARLVRLAGPELLLSITPNRALRTRVLEVFDQTFRITYALQAIAILVAVLGVFGTLTALVLERRREIGILRATGALRRQVMKIVLVESGMLGLIGALLGSIAGVLLALVLVHVINTQYFGWTIRMAIDPWVFVGVLAAMVGAATLAGIGPARLAAGRLAAEAVRGE